MSLFGLSSLQAAPPAAGLGVSGLSAVLLGACVLGLSACVFGPTPDQDMERAIKAHYARHATEEAGQCRTPEIDTIQSRSAKAADESDVELVAVRYSYFDRNADMDANWSSLVHLSQTCGGIAERDFVLARSDLGYRVTDMSGERRKGESGD